MLYKSFNLNPYDYFNLVKVKYISYNYCILKNINDIYFNTSTLAYFCI